MRKDGGLVYSGSGRGEEKYIDGSSVFMVQLVGFPDL